MRCPLSIYGCSNWISGLNPHIASIAVVAPIMTRPAGLATSDTFFPFHTVRTSFLDPCSSHGLPIVFAASDAHYGSCPVIGRLAVACDIGRIFRSPGANRVVRAASRRISNTMISARCGIPRGIADSYQISPAAKFFGRAPMSYQMRFVRPCLISATDSPA